MCGGGGGDGGGGGGGYDDGFGGNYGGYGGLGIGNPGSYGGTNDAGMTSEGGYSSGGMSGESQYGGAGSGGGAPAGHQSTPFATTPTPAAPAPAAPAPSIPGGASPGSWEAQVQEGYGAHVQETYGTGTGAGGGASTVQHQPVVQTRAPIPAPTPPPPPPPKPNTVTPGMKLTLGPMGWYEVPIQEQPQPTISKNVHTLGPAPQGQVAQGPFSFGEWGNQFSYNPNTATVGGPTLPGQTYAQNDWNPSTTGQVIGAGISALTGIPGLSGLFGDIFGAPTNPAPGWGDTSNYYGFEEDYGGDPFESSGEGGDGRDATQQQEIAQGETEQVAGGGGGLTTGGDEGGGITAPTGGGTTTTNPTQFGSEAYYDQRRATNHEAVLKSPGQAARDLRRAARDKMGYMNMRLTDPRKNKIPYIMRYELGGE